MITRASNLFDDMLGSIDYDPEEAGLFPFFVRVGCVKMAAPRHDRFEYMMNFGMGDIDKVFKGTELGSSLAFVFPERFMGVHEQQGFMYSLKKHPSVNRGIVKAVDIITSSPLIVGGFKREMIRILTWPDDEVHNGRPQWAM